MVAKMHVVRRISAVNDMVSGAKALNNNACGLFRTPAFLI